MALHGNVDTSWIAQQQRGNNAHTEADAQWLELWKRIQAVIKAPGSPWTDELILKAAGVDQIAATFLGPAGAFIQSERGGLGLRQESRERLVQFLDNIDQHTPGRPSPSTMFRAFKDRNQRRLYQANIAMFMINKVPPLSGWGLVLAQPGDYDGLSADAKVLIDELFAELQTADPPLQLTTADVQFIQLTF